MQNLSAEKYLNWKGSNTEKRILNMASVKFEKGSKEWLMFQDYWKLCQKFWVPEDNDEYWEMVKDTTDDFYEKYKDIALAREIAGAFVKVMEKQYKANQQKQNGGTS